jgi:hypothetical protein
MDWEVRPMHPVRIVPYALAAIWDARQEEQQRKAARRTSAIKAAMAKSKDPLITAPPLPRSLRAKIKHSHGAKSLLQELEEEVRKFVQKHREAEAKHRRRDSSVLEDEDDDDFVVVRPQSSHSIDSDYVDLGAHPEREKLVFHSLEDDQTAGFGYVVINTNCDAANISVVIWFIHLVGTMTLTPIPSPKASRLVERHMLRSRTPNSRKRPRICPGLCMGWCKASIVSCWPTAFSSIYPFSLL